MPSLPACSAATRGASARVEIEAKVAAGYLGGEAFHTDAPSIGRTLVE